MELHLQLSGSIYDNNQHAQDTSRVDVRYGHEGAILYCKGQLAMGRKTNEEQTAQ
jgi:hypothetical protein